MEMKSQENKIRTRTMRSEREREREREREKIKNNVCMYLSIFACIRVGEKGWRADWRQK